MSSQAELLASLTDSERAEALGDLTEGDAAQLLYRWQFWARKNQLPPDTAWAAWLVMAGRGFGKTRVGAEWVRHQAETGKARRIALVAPTAGDARDTMVEGESGLLAISPPWFRPKYEPSKRRLTWPNGARATLFSADEPGRLRGPQHDAAWCDELAAWRYPEAWDQLMFGLRLGDRPQVVATTTPKPKKFLIDLAKEPGTHVTRGSTYDNLQNLAPTFRETILKRYEGTNLGRQELLGELLEDLPGALWQRSQIEALRVPAAPKDMLRVVVAIDPAVTSGEEADETGIIVAAKGRDGHGYTLADLSGRYSPLGWANVAIRAYHQYKADRVIGEVNNGGEMIESTLRGVDPKVSYRAVHASRGKAIRAEPIAALYEKGEIHHVGGFSELEDQMVTWTPESDVSPDRMDALVWAMTDLMIDTRDTPTVPPMGMGGSSRWR